MKKRDMLAPLGLLFSFLSGARGRLYDWKVKPAESVGVPVVSVGNLTVGGTGKTPVIAALIEWAIQSGYRPGVVSRGYGRQSYGVQAVHADDESAERFGDEPTMLKKQFVNVPIYVGADRVQAAMQLVSEHPVNLIFADDAFQHRKLKRDIDIVLIDATAPTSDYHPLPWGMARESFESLRRAQFVILTKVNLASSDNLKFIENKLSAVNGDFKTIRADYLVTSELNDLSACCFVVCGLGRPEAFLASLQMKGFNVVGSLLFPDHHAYSETDAVRIVSEMKKLGASVILTTEKDFVKLDRHKNLKDFVQVVSLQLGFSSDVEILHEEISSKTL